MKAGIDKLFCWRRPSPVPLARGGWALLGLLITLSLTSQPGASSDHDVLDPVRCDVTHLILDDCPNVVKATFQDGRHHWSFEVAGPIALFKKLEDYEAKPENILIRDYDTMKLESPKMLLAKDAWFLYDAMGDVAVSTKPHIYAFKTKEAAAKAQETLHGKLLEWDELHKRAEAFATTWQPNGKHHIELQGRPE